MTQQTAQIKHVIALDVGERRVGVAAANSLARLVAPVTTLIRDETFWSKLEDLLRTEGADTVVVGLPRNLDGNDTAQTTATRKFVAELQERFGLNIALQDEALTSRQAEAELRARGKNFAKGEIDALAAVYILEDYLQSEGGRV